MNAASVVVISVVVVLLLISVACAWKNRKNRCDGNCNGCALQCSKK